MSPNNYSNEQVKGAEERKMPKEADFKGNVEEKKDIETRQQSNQFIDIINNFNTVKLSMETGLLMAELLIEIIKEKTGLSFQKIANKLQIDKFGKGQICLISKGRWFPKDSQRASLILEQLVFLYKKEIMKSNVDKENTKI